MRTPNKIIPIITKMQNNNKHFDNSTSNKGAHSIIDSTCDTIVLVVLGVTILRLVFRLRKKVVRDNSKGISNQGVKMGTKTLK